MNRNGWTFRYSLKRLFGVTFVIAVFCAVIVFLRSEPRCLRSLRGFRAVIHTDYSPTTENWAKPLGLIRLQRVQGVIVEDDLFADLDLRDLIHCYPNHELIVNSSSVTDGGVRHIADMPGLSMVKLDCSQISDHGLSHLAKLKDLEDLEISGSSHVSGAFLLEFSRSAPPAMRKISLHGKSVDDTSCEALAKFRRLGVIDLSDTSISDKGIALIGDAKIERLSALNVRRTKVTEQAIGLFVANNPEVKVLYGTK